MMMRPRAGRDIVLLLVGAAPFPLLTSIKEGKEKGGSALDITNAVKTVASGVHESYYLWETVRTVT
jgi:hypothetical protein